LHIVVFADQVNGSNDAVDDSDNVDDADEMTSRMAT